MWDIMPERASSYAVDVDNVIMVVTYTVGFWLIATYVVFFLFLIFFRKRKGRPARHIPGTGRQMAWVFVPILFVVLSDIGIDLYNAPIWSKIKQEFPETEELIGVEARQWMWRFRYPGADGKLYTADDIETVNEMHVRLNAKTRFVLTATDVLHSFSIPTFRIKQDAVPGRRIEGWFEAIKTGTFDIQCAEICGAGHSAMAARVIVHDQAGFEKALAAAVEPPPRQIKSVAAMSIEAAFTSREN